MGGENYSKKSESVVVVSFDPSESYIILFWLLVSKPSQGINSNYIVSWTCMQKKKTNTNGEENSLFTAGICHTVEDYLCTTQVN